MEKGIPHLQRAFEPQTCDLPSEPMDFRFLPLDILDTPRDGKTSKDTTKAR